jgi:hypothetical protein
VNEGSSKNLLFIKESSVPSRLLLIPNLINSLLNIVKIKNIICYIPHILNDFLINSISIELYAS